MELAGDVEGGVAEAQVAADLLHVKVALEQLLLVRGQVRVDEAEAQRTDAQAEPDRALVGAHAEHPRGPDQTITANLGLRPANASSIDTLHIRSLLPPIFEFLNQSALKCSETILVKQSVLLWFSSIPCTKLQPFQ